MPTISRQEHAALFGPTVGDKIRLGDTDLFVEIEKDLRHYGDESMYGGGKTLRGGMGGDAHAPRHGAWVSVFRQLDTTQAHSAPFPIKISVSHSTPKAGSGEGATGHFPPLSNFEAFDGESAGPRPRRAAMRVTPVRASAVPRPG